MEKKGFFQSSLLLLKSRAGVLRASLWIGTFSTIIAGKGLPSIYEAYMSIIAVSIIIASVYIYNDVIDREQDAYSRHEYKKDRPLASRKVSVTNAMKFVYLTGIIGLGLSLMISPVVLGVAFTYYTLLILYSHPKVRFKEIFIVKNIVQALLMPTIFIITGIAVENKLSLRIFSLGIVYYVVTNLISPAMADMIDMEEDLAFNIKTIGNSLSWKNNLILFNLGILVLSAYNIMSYLLFDFNYFIPIVSSMLGIPLILYSYKLRTESGITASHKLRPTTAVIYILHPLIFALGAVF